jgi:hypothetical protein
MSDISDDENDQYNNESININTIENSFNNSNDQQIDNDDDDDDEILKKRKLDIEHEYDKKQKTDMLYQEEINMDEKRELCNLRVSTFNVKSFCNILSGFKSIPSLELVLLSFSPEGMTMFGKPDHSAAAVFCFWNTEMFVDYKCDKPIIQKWIRINRCEELRKKISKGVKILNISNIVDDIPGFSFSCDKNEENGIVRKCMIKALEISDDRDIVSPSRFTFDCQLMTSSYTFKESINFISDSSDFLRLKIENDSMIFEGFDDTGSVIEETSQIIDGKSDIEYECLFMKKYLMFVHDTFKLHPNLNIHFKTKGIGPVLFHYALDSKQPQSHFSIYIVPKTSLEN